MDMTSSKAIQPVQLDEAKKLREIFEARQQSAKDAGRKLTQADLGKSCGWASGQSVVNQLLSGRMPISLEALVKLAHVLKFSPREVSPRLAASIDLMARLIDRGRVDPKLEIEAFRLPITSGSVPVTMLAKVDKAGGFQCDSMPAGERLGLLSIYCDDPSAYAVMIVGNGLSPRLRSHEFVVVTPKASPVAGDDVLVIKTDGEHLIREYIYHRDGQLRLDSLIPGGDGIYLDEDEVLSIHCIDGIVKKNRFEPS